MVSTQPVTRYAATGDLSIAYQVVGEGPPDVVAVPGFQSHVELSWEYVFASTLLEHAASYSRLLFFDKRGSGLSDRSLGAGTLEDRIDDIRAVMDAAGLESAAIVGVSNGGPLAAAFAATYPERVTGLVLYLAALPEGDDPYLAETLDLVRQHWGTGLVMNELVAHAPDPAAAIEHLARFERYTCTPAVCVDILRHMRESDLSPFLGLITAPTLVINHREDPLIPLDQADRLAAHIPGARQVVVEGDFHLSWRPADYEAPLAHIKEFLTGIRDAPQASDRMLATVLFTDIVRSTDRVADLGDASWGRLLDRHDEISREEVARRGGVVVKHTGDGTLARFDSPGRAVEGALAIRSRMGPLGLRTRAGVHTGEVERRGDDLGGLAVHIASRLVDRAEPDEVLASRTVKDLTIGGTLTYDDRGLHDLRGVPGTWRLFAAR